MRKNNAYILIFTMTMLSLITVLTHQLLRLVYVGTHFDVAMVDREHAEMLALGGINLAMAQLRAEKPKEKDKKKEKKNPEQEKKEKKKEFEAFLTRVLPHLNRWQVFKLDKEIDGIDGELKICVTCENGKININEAFDFQKQEFKPIYKKFLSSLRFRGETPPPKGEKGKPKKFSPSKFLKELTEFLKTRNRKLEDISQLQSGIKTGISQLFYEPPQRTKKIKQAKPNVTLTFQDIFTIHTKTDKVEALFLSDSLSALLHCRRPRAHDLELRKEKFKKFIKNFDQKKDQNTAEYWKMVNPLYERKAKMKPETLKIFSSTFEPTTYSVLSSGKVGNVEQRLLAVIELAPPEKKIEKKEEEKESKKKEKKGKTKKQAPPFRIIRLYWI